MDEPSSSIVRRFELDDMIRDRLDQNGEQEGIYQLYTRPGNQLVIEADGSNWNNIPWYSVLEATDWEAAEWKEVPVDGEIDTRRLAEILRRHGYDSVRINGIQDSGGRNNALREMNPYGIYGDIGIFFNQNDVKSADTITYDDQGNAIPLDQRFSDNKDIRYSSVGETTLADLEQAMSDAGFDASSEDRILRQIDQYNQTLNAMSSGSFDNLQVKSSEDV